MFSQNSTFFVTDYESKFDCFAGNEWMVRHWHRCFYYVGIYLISIFAGQYYMKSRPRFELRIQLFLWNLMLALFSIFGTLRTATSLLNLLCTYGFHHIACDPQFLYQNNLCAWYWFFAVSKVVELGDTAFIVLRKQHLSFLHWYHHVTVLVYVWYAGAWITASGRCFIVMNYTVHSLMYSYYTLKTLKIQIPRGVSIFITIIQLLQMVFGTFINIWTFRALLTGEYCFTHNENIQASLLMYFSYFLLFLHFFFKAYIAKKPSIGPHKSVKMD